MGRFESDSEDSEQPDVSENGQSPNPAKRTEREGCVGAGDKKENRTVIEHSESLFSASRRPGVIKHRHEIESEHRRDEHDYSGEKAGVAGTPGSNEQDWRGNNGSDQADEMANGIGEFFARLQRPIKAQKLKAEKLKSAFG